MTKQTLHENWTVRAVGDLSEVPSPLRGLAIPARVPGCVHTDLLRAGKIPDPYRDLNEFATRWIGHTDWEYRTTFDADPKVFDHERIDLVCDGLDTVARIELNGSLVAETFNMHRGYRFDVRSMLRRGPNELRITFASPVKYAQEMERQLGRRPYCNGPAGPFNFIRKMACNFGWDWGPALPTSGIWRGVRVEGWSDVRIAAAFPQFVADHLEVLVQLDGSRASDALLEIRLAGAPGVKTQMRDSHRVGSGLLQLHVENPELWWPVGYGKQSRYVLHVETSLSDEPNETVDRKMRLIGLRTLELDTSPDDIGRKFVLKVNGKPIFCKGFNWIPDDCFLDRACEPARVRQRIQQAVDAGANMLRVWGGGIYETDDFYSICDELGVLVWQDFPFACAMYPEEEPFWSEVEAEARYNVARLAHHPSLAIWNGCNENIWGYRDWGWKDHADQQGKTWGKNYYFDLLPRICRELTPAIPYWAGSPWSGDQNVDTGVPPNADTHGNMHVWKPWFHEDYQSYREFQPRFCSEFGFQAPATYASIASVVPQDARDFGHMQMRHRQKSGDRSRDDGDRRNLRHLLRHFNLPGAAELLDALTPPDPKAPVPYCGCEPLLPAKSLPSQVNFDDLHYLLQVNQARALTLGVEWFRSRQPRCMGTLYWQLNDCWPGVTSWSCIDADGRPKPLWYATRRFFADRLLTIQPEKDGLLSLVFINDTDEAVTKRVGVVRWTMAGERINEQWLDVQAEPRSVRRMAIDRAVATPRDPGGEFLSAGEAAGFITHGEAPVCQPPTQTTWFFAADRELRYPQPKFQITLQRPQEGRHLLSIWAESLIRDLCVFVDRLDPEATVSEQLVTLLPRETVEFEIASKLPLTQEQLTSPPVLQCVNPFGRQM